MGTKKMAGRQGVLLLLLLVMCLILWNSSRPASVSSVHSKSISAFVASLVVPGFDEMSGEERRAVIAAVNTPLRQFAHAFEFALLGMLAMGLRYTSAGRRGPGFQLFSVMAFCVAFAFADETLQLFVDGRAFQLGDILTDAVGALIGSAGTMAMVRKRGKV